MCASEMSRRVEPQKWFHLMFHHMCANQNKWTEIFHHLQPPQPLLKQNRQTSTKTTPFRLSLRQIGANIRTYADGNDFVFEFRATLITIGMYISPYAVCWLNVCLPVLWKCWKINKTAKLAGDQPTTKKKEHTSMYTFCAETFALDKLESNEFVAFLCAFVGRVCVGRFQQTDKRKSCETCWL